MVRLPAYISNRISEVTSVQAPPKPRKKLGKTYVAGLVLTLGLVVAGCAPSADRTSVTPTPDEPVEMPQKETSSVKADAIRDKPTPTQPGNQQVVKPPVGAGEMVTVSVYTIDEQCNDFVEESVQVPSDAAIAEAVGKAVNSVDYNAFKLADYEVSITGNTAIVDMRLAPGSERQFVSLSSCEQRALFGSVEETLKNNADWAVDNVKFTDDGKDLIL